MSTEDKETLGQHLQRVIGWGVDGTPAPEDPVAEARAQGLDVDALVDYAIKRHGGN